MSIRAISSKNVVIVMCSQVTTDCHEKPESSTEKDIRRNREREREKENEEKKTKENRV